MLSLLLQAGFEAQEMAETVTDAAAAAVEPVAQQQT